MRAAAHADRRRRRRSGRMLERKIDAHPEYGLELVGFVDDDSTGRRACSAAPTTSPRLVDELRDRLGRDRLLATRRTSETLELVRAVRRPDVHLSIVPNYFELFASNATIEDIEGMPVVSLPPMRLSRTVARAQAHRRHRRRRPPACSSCCRRCSPPCALAIRLDSRGPGLLPPGAPRARRAARSGSSSSARWSPAPRRQRFALAHLNDMEGGGPAVQDPRRPAHHARRRASCASGASTSCRSCGTCCAAR